MNLEKAENLACSLMAMHGLFGQLWSFRFDRSLTRLGLCNHRKRIISLSQYVTLVNNETEVKNTILHEIAHALVGPNEGHGPVWKTTAKEIGCTGERLGNISVKAPYKYQMYCLDCSYIWKYYRKPKLGPCYIHKCNALLERIGYTHDKPWKPVESNLKVEILA